MDQLSSIYRFHDHPVMYVYTTLHYYEKVLVEYPILRKKLVSIIIGALQDLKPLQRWGAVCMVMVGGCVMMWGCVRVSDGACCGGGKVKSGVVLILPQMQVLSPRVL